MTGPHLLPLLLLYALMLPVTGMVPVLPEFTAQRFPGLGQFASHFFMSINMIGALLGAPIAGLLSDRLGKRRLLAVGALAVNGIALLGIAWAWRSTESYALLLALRLVEGFAHMSALSLLMALAADHAGKAGLGARMGAVGASISLGVATGAPLGASSATSTPSGCPSAAACSRWRWPRSASSASPRAAARGRAWRHPRSSTPCATVASC